MPHLYCAQIGCSVNNINSPFMHFHCILAFPAQLPKNATKQQYIKREGQLLLSAEIEDCSTFKWGLIDGSYRICEEHEFTRMKKSKMLTWGKDKEGNNIQWSQSYDLYVLSSEGPKSVMSLKTRDSHGIGIDRQALRTLEVVNDQIKSNMGDNLL